MRRALALLLVVSACSVQDGPTGTANPTFTTTTIVAVTTTTEAPRSTAVVLIGPARYEIDALCAAGGAGEVEVSLSGEDVNGLPVIGYIRAFLGEPYISLQVGTGDEAVLFEPRLEGTLPFDLTDSGVVFPEVDFVSALDLEAGGFVPAGLGKAEVECLDYVRTLPPVPFE
jgi:hypothetical protein